MVIQTERYPGGYHHNNYSAYQGPNGSSSNYEDVTEQTTPYLGYGQGSTYQSIHASQQQSGWSTGGGYQSSGGSHYSSGGGMGAHLKPTHGGYGSSPHDGYGGSQHGGYGSPHGQSHHGLRHSHGGSHGYGNSHGYGGGASNQFNKLTHGHNGYGHGPNGMNHSSQKPTWDLKGIDSDDE